jgi:hypothetical protein
MVMGSSFKRNRIINGNMAVDQRSSGASVTATTQIYTLDRWNALGSVTSKYTVQQTTTAPAGFANSLKVTSSASTSLSATDYYYIQQNIEGLNISDFNFGSSNAKTVTLSFWVQSSLTGSFGGVLSNSAVNRSYPFSYSISAANTWTQISIVIPGDTTGTWLTDTGTGLRVDFGLGVGTTYSGTAGAWAASLYLSTTSSVSVVGTSGATFYITGVQLESGTVATPYEFNPYNDQLAQCQRYYTRFQNVSNVRYCNTRIETPTTTRAMIPFPVFMRVAPTVFTQSGAATFAIAYLATATVCNADPVFLDATLAGARMTFTIASGMAAGQIGEIFAATAGYIAFASEL